jgi:hypothetical protein
MEARIYPLAVDLDDRQADFNRAFFYKTPNRLLDKLPGEEVLLNCLRLIRVEDYRPGRALTLVMNDEPGKAVAYIKGSADNRE